MRAALAALLLAASACAAAPRAPSGVPSQPPVPTPPRELPPSTEPGQPSPTPAPPQVETEARPSSSPPAKAATDEQPTAPEPPPVTPKPPAAKPAEQERILGTFAIDPERVVYLTPALLERRPMRTSDPDVLEGLAESLAQLGARRGEAAALLGLGALRWVDGDAEDAYEAIMRAQSLFAELGDVEGLAHAYEWLGYLFRESGEPTRAAEHLSVAYGMFGLLENTTAQERILGYAPE